MNYTTNPSRLQDERDLALLISRSLLFGDWIDHDGIWPWKRLKFSLPNEVFYCRCLITNDKEHYIDQTSSHTMMQSRKWLYSLLRGKTAGKLISWEVRHDQRGPNDIPDAPQTPHHGTNFFRYFLWSGVTHWNYFIKLINVDGIKCLVQKTLNFEPLPTGKSVVISYLISTIACLNFPHPHLILAWALHLLHENHCMFCFSIFCIINPHESWN